MRRWVVSGRALLCAFFCLCTLALPVRAHPVCECDPGDASTPPPNAMLVGVPATGQWWNLSCEFAAASAATGYYGTAIPQGIFLDEIGYDPNPHRGFRGRITGPWGGVQDYGVYAEPIEEALHAHGFARSYTFYGDAERLRAAIAAGHPVVAWVTGTWRASIRYRQTAGGEAYSVIPYEHAVTVYGYDAAGVWVMDPTDATKYHVGWDTFLLAWSQFDQMALVVAR